MIKIKENLVSSSIASKVTYGGRNTIRYLIIHETANTSRGANADAHGRLQANGNSRQASWHYQVCDKEIVKSFDDLAQCWHAGNAYYNKNSIGIEICVNSDSDFKKAIENAIELVKYLMKKYNIPASNVLQHNDASGKDCPRYLRAGSKSVTWNDFKKGLTGDTTIKASKPAPSRPKATGSTYTGSSIVDYLNLIGENPSVANRRRLAKEYGVSNYNTTAGKNLELLNAMRGGKKPTANKVPAKPVSTASFKVGSNATIKTSAKKFATGQSIASFAKGKSYKILQAQSDRVLLDGIMSWVLKKDLVGYTGTTSKPAPKPTAKPSSNAYRVGQKVKIKASAKKYSRANANIPSMHKNKNYTIQQVGNNDVLIKELYSWVKKSDLQGSTNTTATSKPASKPKTYRVGQKVKIKSNAKTYATGEAIPARFKNKTYTIQQVGKGRMLIKELVSWVRTSDLQ